MNESKYNTSSIDEKIDHIEQSCETINTNNKLPNPIDMSEFNDLMDTLESKSERPLSKTERSEVTNLFSTVADSNAMKNLIRLFRKQLAKVYHIYIYILNLYILFYTYQKV